MLENGDVFAAKVFADASYEGDLMAQAGVSYTWGREGTNEYGESLAGVREHTPLHQFRVPVSPVDDAGKTPARDHGADRTMRSARRTSACRLTTSGCA